MVWRLDGPHLLVAVVHRPRYDDWTLPKGKAEPGEPLLLTAIREVAEETGAQVQAGRRLSVVEYPIADGTIKRVSHWAMRYLAGEHVPTDEVDELRWLTVAEATQLLTYPIDRYVLAEFARVPAETRTVMLIRHAKAGKRAEYRGDDRTRPLDKIGRRHARDAAVVLAAFAPQRVLSADLVRCQQTVQPLADRLGLPVQSAAGVLRRVLPAGSGRHPAGPVPLGRTARRDRDLQSGRGDPRPAGRPGGAGHALPGPQGLALGAVAARPPGGHRRLLPASRPSRPRPELTGLHVVGT